MTRGKFLWTIVAGLLAASAPKIDGARLRRRLEALSQDGRPAGGTFADGVSRVAFSDADVAGRTRVMGWMREAGLTPRIDAAGNIFGVRPGLDAAAKPILFGSHIDSVPMGGNFDGDLGVLASIEVIQVLNEANVRTRRPLEIVVWSNEEGVSFGRGLFGSRVAAGLLDPGEMETVWNGVKKTDAVRKIGGVPEKLEAARRGAGFFEAYIELHIEQGGNLEKESLPIGVVEGIVAIDRYDVEIRGFANHAGTTPMPDRHDALVAASHLAVAVNEIVRAEPGRQVGTVGRLELEPNAPNVIPGVARLSVELRDLSAEKIARLGAKIQERAREIAKVTRTTVEFRHTSHHQSAIADAGLQDVIEKSAKVLGLRSRRLPSGAGHDAQSMARLGPMAMIFVPSIGGISHSPKELTSWEDCARGGDVLLQAVLSLSR
jgi:N-carbamoyl-L-amino-acid hydrolase